MLRKRIVILILLIFALIPVMGKDCSAQDEVEAELKTLLDFRIPGPRTFEIDNISEFFNDF